MAEALRLFIESDPAMSVGTLREWVQPRMDDPAYLLTAAEITVGADETIQHHGCTLLCDAVDAKVILPDEVVTLLEENVDSVRDWRAQLGLCQLLSQPKAAARFDPTVIGAFSDPLTRSPNAFVRAWATTALALVARRDDRFVSAAREAIERCQQDVRPAAPRRENEHLESRRYRYGIRERESR